MASLWSYVILLRQFILNPILILASYWSISPHHQFSLISLWSSISFMTSQYHPCGYQFDRNQIIMESQISHAKHPMKSISCPMLARKYISLVLVNCGSILLSGWCQPRLMVVVHGIDINSAFISGVSLVLAESGRFCLRMAKYEYNDKDSNKRNNMALYSTALCNFSTKFNLIQLYQNYLWWPTFVP